MSRKILLLCMALLFALFVVPTGSIESTALAESQPVVVKVAPSTLPPPPAFGQTLVIDSQLKLIGTVTKGQVKPEIYWSQTLAKATDLTTAVQTGLADMALIRPYGEPGKLPLSSIGEMPGISTDLWALLWAYWDLVNQDPIKSSEMAKFKMRPIWTIFTQEVIIISKGPIRTLADIKGKKTSAGGIAAEILKSLGAVPLAMSPTEQYEGLLRGTIDAIAAPPDAMQVFKFYDAGKYITNLPLGPRLQPFVINQDTWNKLSADTQKGITDALPDLINLSYKKIFEDTNGPVFKEMKAAGVQIIDLPAGDLAEVEKIRAAYADKWAADQEAKGLAGKKVLADYRSLAEKYEKKSPYKK